MKKDSKTNSTIFASILCLLLTIIMSISSKPNQNRLESLLDILCFSILPFLIILFLDYSKMADKFDSFFFSMPSIFSGFFLSIIGISHNISLSNKNFNLRFFIHASLTIIIIPLVVILINYSLKKANVHISCFSFKCNPALLYLKGGCVCYSSIILSKIYVSQVSHQYYDPAFSILYVLYLSLSVYFCLKPLLAYLGGICSYAKNMRNNTETEAERMVREKLQLKNIFPFRLTIAFIILLAFWELYLGVFREEIGIKYFFGFANIVLFATMLIILYQGIMLYNTKCTYNLVLIVVLGMLTDTIIGIIIMAIGAEINLSNLLMYFAFAFLCILFVFYIFYIRFYDNILNKYEADNLSGISQT